MSQTNAVVAGKFWPLHKGHVGLLTYAAMNSSRLDILLVAKDNQRPTGAERALAIYEELAELKREIRVHVIGDLETDDDDPESSKYWAEYTKAILGFTPDLVVSSEPYGARWAAEMGCFHRLYDENRISFPISGTECRRSYSDSSFYLPASMKAQLLPRVVVLGAESTGTTTLSNELAAHYGTVAVPEFGRLIAEDRLAKGTPLGVNDWDDTLFWEIAHGQDAMEERFAREANRVLICDTDSLATAVWYKRYHKDANIMQQWFMEHGIKQAAKHDLYILTSMGGIPWEDDGTRDGEAERSWMETDFLQTMILLQHQRDQKAVPFIVVTGDREERLERAIFEIDKLLMRNKLPALVP